METNENIKTVETWMKDISVALGVELNLDSEGICAFQIGEDTIITIEVSPEFPMVNLYSPLLTLPADDVDAATAMMARALELNAFQALTRGGAIAIPPGGGPLIYCYNTPIEGMDSDTFSRILGSFFETIPELRNMLTQASTVPTPGKPKENTFGKIKI